MLVGDRPHNRAHGQAVEAVVQKNQQAQQGGGQLGAALGFDAPHRPAAIGGSAPRAGDNDHQRPQQHQKNDHHPVVADFSGHHLKNVCNRLKQAAPGRKAIDAHPGQHSQEQGGVDLLCEQSKNNGYHRRQNGQPARVNHFQAHKNSTPPFRGSIFSSDHTGLVNVL